jgi:hypothetical protein
VHIGKNELPPTRLVRFSNRGKVIFILKTRNVVTSCRRPGRLERFFNICPFQTRPIKFFTVNYGQYLFIKSTPGCPCWRPTSALRVAGWSRWVVVSVESEVGCSQPG